MTAHGSSGGHLAAGAGSFPSGRRGRLVVVDDDAATRGLLADVLDGAGYEVLALAAPPEVGELVDLRPDLLLLDLMIRGHEDGVAYLRTLRDDPEAAWMPVIVCSGAEDLTDNALDGLVPWHGGVVRKPFANDELLAAVCRALERAAQSPPASIVTGAFTESAGRAWA